MFHPTNNTCFGFLVKQTFLNTLKANDRNFDVPDTPDVDQLPEKTFERGDFVAVYIHSRRSKHVYIGEARHI